MISWSFFWKLSNTFGDFIPMDNKSTQDFSLNFQMLLLDILSDFFFIWSKSYHSSSFRWSALMACSTDHVDGTMLYVVILLKTIKTTTKEKKVYNHLKSRMFYSLFGICLQKQVSFLRSSSASSAATNDSRWVHVTQMYWTQKRSIRSGSSCMLFIHEVVNSLIIYWESMLSSIS